MGGVGTERASERYSLAQIFLPPRTKAEEALKGAGQCLEVLA